MALTTAKSSLILPQTVQGHPTLVAAINSSFQKIQQMLDSSNATVPSARGLTVVGGSGSTTGASQVQLSVPGTLAVMSYAAPLVELPFTITPTSIVALIKQAPVGAAITYRVKVAGVSYFSASVGTGLLLLSSGGTFQPIAANSLITVDIVSVGTTFPGSDLSVLIQF
jgi:hypothetical protein